MDTMAGATIGNKLRYYRKLRNLTQEELAEKVGIAPTHITNIERDKRGVSLEVLRLICKNLEINLADILPDEARDDSELREKLILEVVGVMTGLDTEKLGIVRTMVGALGDG